MNRKLTKKLLFIARMGLLGFFIWQMSAVHFSVDSRQDITASTVRDTTITFCESNIHIDFKPVSTDFIDIDDFIAFCQGYCTIPVRYEKKEQIDTTGDGHLETVRSTVELIAGACKVRNTIEKDGHLIWDDEMIVDNEHGAYLFGGKDNYQRFYPLSAFYLGAVNAPFIDELDNNNRDYSYRKNFFVNKLIERNDSQMNKEGYASISDYLDNYKGKYVFSLNMASRDIFMWDNIKKAFVPLYLS